MTQEGARIKLIDISKKHVKDSRRNLIRVSVIALGTFAAILGLARVNANTAKILSSINIIFYMELAAKFYKPYRTWKRVSKRLEAGFEEDMNYIEMYEECMGDSE